jgi:putative SbcD/Mre11-related phosphoesterase
MVKFLAGKEAAVHGGAVLISDLHLGMESSLFERGVRGMEISGKLAEKTLGVLEETGKKTLIIVGDVKENLVGVPKEAREYLREVGEHAEVIVVKGNHDGGIERVAGVETVGAEGFVYRKLGVFHGHAWPAEEVMECRSVLMGHNHPHVKVAGQWEPAWIEMRPEKSAMGGKYPGYNRGMRLVLMPSFNPLLGTDIVRTRGLGPVLKNKLFKFNTAIVYTLGGTKLGKLSAMEKRF